MNLKRLSKAPWVTPGLMLSAFLLGLLHAHWAFEAGVVDGSIMGTMGIRTAMQKVLLTGSVAIVVGALLNIEMRRFSAALICYAVAGWIVTVAMAFS